MSTQPGGAFTLGLFWLGRDTAMGRRALFHWDVGCNAVPYFKALPGLNKPLRCSYQVQRLAPTWAARFLERWYSVGGMFLVSN